MKQSYLFTKTRKEVSGEEVSKNAQLLLRGGYIHKEMAGVYAYLPLGKRVLERIANIVREEMNAAGALEIQMTALQDKSNWEATNRWDDAIVDNWFKTKLKNETELGLGFTHEEPITAMMKSFVSSYRDLPKAVYQIQTKFRNELRAKSGIMRGREFLMKDLYSFCRTAEEQDHYYEFMKGAYKKVYERLGLGDRTYITFASGGIFSKYSHEFQTLSEAGEDTIYIHEEKNIAINEEVYNDEVLRDLGLKKEDLVQKKAIEVGNIFTLGTRFSEPLGLTFVNEAGESKPVVMGSYGIGVSRLMGVIVEIYNDEKGIVWPEAVAPFQVHLVSLCREEADVAKANEIYEKLKAKGVEVLYDDRDGVRPGEKFADADLLGMPKRVVVSAKTIEKGVVEVVNRKTGEVAMVPVAEFLA